MNTPDKIFRPRSLVRAGFASALLLAATASPAFAFTPPPVPGSAPAPTNEPPVLSDDSGLDVEVVAGESVELALPDAGSRGSDAQGDAFAFALVGAGADGTVDVDGGRATLRAGGSGQVLTFVADEEFAGGTTLELRLVETETSPALESAGRVRVAVTVAALAEPEPVAAPDEPPPEDDVEEVAPEDAPEEEMLEEETPAGEIPEDEAPGEELFEGESPEEGMPENGPPEEEMPEEEGPEAETPAEGGPDVDVPVDMVPSEEVAGEGEGAADEGPSEEVPVDDDGAAPEEAPTEDEVPVTDDTSGEGVPAEDPSVEMSDGQTPDDDALVPPAVPGSEEDESVDDETAGEGDESVEAAEGGTAGEDAPDEGTPDEGLSDGGETPVDGPAPTDGTDADVALAKPVAFRLVLTDERAIALEWEPVAGATGYELSRDGEIVATVEDTLFVDGDVVPGQRYEYALVAVDGSDGSRSAPAALGASAVSNVRADDVRPIAPGEVIARRDVDGSVVLAWRPGGDDIGVVGYNVYRNGAYHDTVRALGYRDTDAPADALTFYEIVAFDAASNFSRLSPATLVDALGEPDRIIDTLSVEGASASVDGRTRFVVEGEGAVILLAGERVVGLLAGTLSAPSMTLDIADGESLDVIVPSGGSEADFRLRLGPAAVAELGSDVRISVRAPSDADGPSVELAPR